MAENTNTNQTKPAPQAPVITYSLNEILTLCGSDRLPYSRSLVRAAFNLAGKKEATVEEALKLSKDFAGREKKVI